MKKVKEITDIARISVVVDTHDLFCDDEFFVKRDNSFEENLEKLMELCDDENVPTKVIFEFINNNFEEVKLKYDYQFNLP
jgi:hypothetical protein